MFHHWWNHYYCGPKWYLRQIFHDSLHRLQTEELLVNCLLDLSWARSPFLTSCDNFNISTSRIFWLIKSFVDDDITVVGIEIEGSYEVVWEPVPVNVFAEKFLFTWSCIIFVDDLCLKFSISLASSFLCIFRCANFTSALKVFLDQPDNVLF